MHHPGFFRSKVLLNDVNGTIAADGLSMDRMKNDSLADSEGSIGVGSARKGTISLTLSSPNRLRLLSNSNSPSTQDHYIEGAGLRCPMIEGSFSSVHHSGKNRLDRQDVSRHWIEGVDLYYTSRIKTFTVLFLLLICKYCVRYLHSFYRHWEARQSFPLSSYIN